MAKFFKTIPWDNDWDKVFSINLADMKRIQALPLFLLFSVGNFIVFFLVIFFSVNCNAQTSIDSIWQKKIAFYKTTQSKFFKTKVFENGAEGISALLQENQKIIDERGSEIEKFKVNEIIIGNYEDIIYSIRNFGLIMNHKGLIGIKCNKNIIQQYTPSYYSIRDFGPNITRNKGVVYKKNVLDPSKEIKYVDDEVFNIKTKTFLKVGLPAYDFLFDRLKPFSYFRITTPKEIETRGNSENNSDMIYSIMNDEIYNPNTLKDGEEEIIKENSLIFFGTSDKYFQRGEKIFDIESGREVYIGIEFGGSTEKRKYNVNDLLTFNDSIFVTSNFTVKNEIKIYNNNNNSLFVFKLQGYAQISEILFAEIDKFGKYLYIEFESDHNRDYPAFRNPKRLIVIDCQLKKLVFHGPYLGIDCTTEKVGFIMTKAMPISLNKNAIPSPEDFEVKKKYNIEWKSINCYKKGAPGQMTWINNMYVFNRYLINMSDVMDSAFLSTFNNVVNSLMPQKNIFTNETWFSFRRKYISDSLIQYSHTWNKRCCDLHKSILFPNLQIYQDTLFYDFCKKIAAVKHENNKEIWNRRCDRFEINKIDDPDTHVPIFQFKIEVDSIPSSLLAVFDNKIRVDYPIVTDFKKVFEKDFSPEQVFSGEEDFLNISGPRIPDHIYEGTVYKRIYESSRYHPFRFQNNLLGFFVVPENCVTTQEKNDFSSFTFFIDLLDNDMAQGFWSEFNNDNYIQYEYPEKGNVRLMIESFSSNADQHYLSSHELELNIFENSPLILNSTVNNGAKSNDLYINKLLTERKSTRNEMKLDIGNLRVHRTHDGPAVGTIWTELELSSNYTYYINDQVFLRASNSSFDIGQK